MSKILNFVTALLCLAVILGFAVSASAFFDAGLQQTLGSGNYAGTYGYADVGQDWHVKPAFDVYHSDTSSGTFKTLSARVGYDQSMWGVGFTGGFSPKVDGYSNNFIGADGVISFTPSGGATGRLAGAEASQTGPRGRGLARFDIGAGITHTNHSDEFQSSNKTGLLRRSAAVHVGETDLNVSAGVSFLDTVLSAQVTKSAYNKDLAAINARPGLNLRLPNLTTIVQGFPNTSSNLRLDWKMIPFVTPYLSYTFTKFELSVPSSKAYTVGAKVGLEILEFSVAYERYVQAGSPDLNYYTIGAGLRL